MEPHVDMYAQDTFFACLVNEWLFEYEKKNTGGVDVHEISYLSPVGEPCPSFHVPCDTLTGLRSHVPLLFNDSGKFAILKKPGHKFEVGIYKHRHDEDYEQTFPIPRYSAWRILSPAKQDIGVFSDCEIAHYWDSNTMENEWYPVPFPKPWINAWQICTGCRYDIGMYTKLFYLTYSTKQIVLCAQCRFTNWRDTTFVERMNKRGDGLSRWTDTPELLDASFYRPCFSTG